MGEVWIVGGTGRVGRGVAARLVTAGLTPVLVGRDADRLHEAAGPYGLRTVVAPTPEAAASELEHATPAVVVNTVGPFTRSATPLVEACLAAGSHYVDPANDLPAVQALLARDAAAVRAGRTLVTAAGFGGAVTESVVAWLCEDARRPVAVLTAMLPSLELQAGVLGEALASTLVEGLPGVPGGSRYQGRRIEHDRLVRAPVGGRSRVLTTPDGDRVGIGPMPLGELVAAQRASGAPRVESWSSEAPRGWPARTLLPIALPLLNLGPVRRVVGRRLAVVRFAPRPAPRRHSWGYAHVTWSDGTATQGWLALDEAQRVTEAVAAEVAHRLALGRGRPGAFTPAALFGPGLARDLGGTYTRVEDEVAAA